MQAVEVVLFIVVAALALSLVAYLVIPRLRAGAGPVVAPRVPEPSPRVVTAAAEMICPTCGREYPAGLKFCPADARPLVPSANAQGAAVGLACPVCKRSFDGGKKFCPYDAEELAPIAVPAVSRRTQRPGGPPGLAHVLGKICPHCSKRYESEATFCGRDGSELVSIN
jgi:predicted amidophosphoribosyltransferase